VLTFGTEALYGLTLRSFGVVGEAMVLPKVGAKCPLASRPDSCPTIATGACVDTEKSRRSPPNGCRSLYRCLKHSEASWELGVFNGEPRPL